MSANPDTAQDCVVAELERDHITAGSGSVRRISTHLSHVFLAGDRAYKLKRAIRLPFADFSTLERRHAACLAELAVNRRTAPELYLDVVPVTREASGALALGGRGPVLDWVVVMKRFADDALFDEIARQGNLSVDLVERTIDRLVEFHESVAPSCNAHSAMPLSEVLSGVRRTAFHGARRHGLSLPSEALFSTLEDRLAAFGPLIEKRRLSGRVRHVHGDLHLGNICLFEGHPVLFDALEFDPKLATTDVLYDLAFLLMDLRHHRLEDHANAALNRYWDAVDEDEGALALMSPLMALRAMVRLAVSLEAADGAGAAAYADLAGSLLAPVQPRFVALGGLSGTGKSTAAKILAPRLSGPCGARILRTDVIRKQRRGAWSPKVAVSTAQARLAVYRRLCAHARAALRGTSVIADGTFQERAARDLIEKASRGFPFRGVWLTAPLHQRLGRVGARRDDASDATRTIAARQKEPASLGASWSRVDASGDAEATVSKILDVLSGSNTRSSDMGGAA